MKQFEVSHSRQYDEFVDVMILPVSQYYHPIDIIALSILLFFRCCHSSEHHTSLIKPNHHHPPHLPPPPLGMKTGGVRRMNIPPELAFVEGVGEGKPGPMPAGFGPQRQVTPPPQSPPSSLVLLLH